MSPRDSDYTTHTASSSALRCARSKCLIIHSFISRITILQFHREFSEGLYSKSYSFDEQVKTLNDIEKFVSDKFGKDQDLIKSIRFLQLVILYN